MPARELWRITFGTLAGRAGKQPDGSAKTREVKLVTVLTAEGRDAEGVPCRDAGSVSYSAAIESAATDTAFPLRSPFAQRVDREARRRGFDQARRRVVLGDGALWIWTLADEQFPGATQISTGITPRDTSRRSPRPSMAPAPIWRALGPAPPRRTRRWPPRRPAGRAPPAPDHDAAGAHMLRIRAPQSASHALSPVPGSGPLRGLRRCRSRLQGRRRDAPQTGRHALDRRRCRCHHRAPVLPTQRPLRRLLGTAVRPGAAA